MMKPRSFGLFDFLLLLVVLGVAGFARFYYLSEFAGNGEAAAVWHVQDLPPTVTAPAEGEAGPQSMSELDALVGRLEKEEISNMLDGFRGRPPLAKEEGPTAHISPLYPVFRALVKKCVPEDVASPAAAVRWAQLGLGTLTCGIYFALALRAFGSRLAALLAGVFCALNPFWLINTAELNDGVLTSFFLAWSLGLGVRVGQQGGALASLLLGFVLAFTALSRAALLPFALVVLFWCLVRSRMLRGGWLVALLAFLGFAIVINPWCIRNYKEFERPVPVTDTAWWHLWVGYNEKATGGPANEAMLATLSPELRNQVAAEKPGKRYELLAQSTVEHVTQYPGDAFRNRLMAGLAFFTGGWVLDRQHGVVASERAGDSEPPPDHPWLVGGLFLALMVMMLLGLWGWRWSHSYRYESMPLQLALFWVPLPYILTHAEGLHGPRLPLDGPLMTLAALAVVCLIPGVGTPLLRGAGSRE